MMEPQKTEFNVAAFAEHYEAVSDSFIDIRGAATSLKRLLPSKGTIFEIGLGTGHFASQFCDEGYHVCGIQPPDEMLARLKSKRLPVNVLAECRLEDYQFVERYETIVSHSSVFLFTRHEHTFGRSGESCVALVFQSFILDRLTLMHNLTKALLALTDAGRIYINVQTNPRESCTVGSASDAFRFEMLSCVYDFDRESVRKEFRTTYRESSTTINDTRYCCTYDSLALRLRGVGAFMRISDDGRWVIVTRQGS